MINNYDSASVYYVTATSMDTTNAKALFDARVVSSIERLRSGADIL